MISTGMIDLFLLISGTFFGEIQNFDPFAILDAVAGGIVGRGIKDHHQVILDFEKFADVFFNAGDIKSVFSVKHGIGGQGAHIFFEDIAVIAPEPVGHQRFLPRLQIVVKGVADGAGTTGGSDGLGEAVGREAGAESLFNHGLVKFRQPADGRIVHQLFRDDLVEIITDSGKIGELFLFIINGADGGIDDLVQAQFGDGGIGFFQNSKNGIRIDQSSRKSASSAGIPRYLP